MTKRTLTQYTEEFRQSTAKLANESEQSISVTARELGIHPTTLHGWVKKYYPKSNNSLSKNQLSTQEQEELKKLRSKHPVNVTCHMSQLTGLHAPYRDTHRPRTATCS